MNKPNSTIAELREAADQAEAEAEDALRDRRAAIVRAAEALRKAGKARSKYLRASASGAQGGDGSNG